MVVLLTDLAEVTPDILDGLGIEVPASLTEAKIGLWRRSSKAKWHWADERSHCKHIPGYSMYGTSSCDVEPHEEIPLLGFAIDRSSICVGCGDRIAVSAPAEAFIAVVAELLRAQDWLQRGREAAADRTWSWMAFAQWKVHCPLTGGTWDTTLRRVRGKGWAAPALTLRGLIADFHTESATVTRACINSIAENPAHTSQIERAMRMVETDTGVADESDLVLRISGCPGETDMFGRTRRYSQDSPWGFVVEGWRSYQAERNSPALLEALCTVLDLEFPHVHDICALDCTEDTTPFEPGDCLHSWAGRSAQAHRRGVVAQWLSRLDLALDGISSADRDPARDCTHLAAVPFWPPIRAGMEPLAYLAQFDVVAGPFARCRGYETPQSVAVLRVPEWAAAHLETLPRRLTTVAIDNEAVQAIQLARAEGIPVVAGEFRQRRKPSQLVEQCRADMDGSRHQYPDYRWRPLTPGAQPPPLYFGQQNPDTEWTWWSVQRVLDRGTEFVYGADDLELLRLAWTAAAWCPAVTLTVELQTECQYHRDPEPHICDVAGDVSAISPDGSLMFTPHELADPVSIPSPYIAALKFK